MSFADKSIKCSDCGFTFTFSAEQQHLYATRGYANDPKRCPFCRALSKCQSDSSAGYSTRRQMFPAVCSQCGRQTAVPFEPRSGRPVHCSDCYSKVRTSR
ncbi:MAG: zinc-ribbon domain containing protein [Chloroflexi bacterium]|nr:zinc-ribbon domain containing protein [Chloroflexota bacterium]